MKLPKPLRPYLTFVWITCCITSVSQAQITSADLQINAGQSFNLNDPYKQLYRDIEGSPYFLSDTLLPTFLQLNGKTSPQMARFNTVTQQIEYRNGKMILTPVGDVAGFTMVYHNDTLRFERLDADQLATSAKYGRVLAIGPTAMLMVTYLTAIRADKDAMSSDFGKQFFVQRETYYLVTNGKATPAKRNADTLKQLCPNCSSKPLPSNWTAFAELIRKQGGHN